MPPAQVGTEPMTTGSSVGGGPPGRDDGNISSTATIRGCYHLDVNLTGTLSSVHRVPRAAHEGEPDPCKN